MNLPFDARGPAAAGFRPSNGNSSDTDARRTLKTYPAGERDAQPGPSQSVLTPASATQRQERYNPF